MENENGRRSELVVCVGMCRRNTLAYSYSAAAAGWGPVKVIEERVREEVESWREEERERDGECNICTIASREMRNLLFSKKERNNHHWMKAKKR